MAKIDAKGVYIVRVKGREYHYAWRNGPRIEARPGTREYLQEILDAKSPHANLNRSKFGTWVVKFKASPEYLKGVSDEHKKDMGPRLDEIADHFGKLSVSTFDRPQIRMVIKDWRDQFSDTPRAADKRKAYLSRLCSFMMENGVLSTNPCSAISDLHKGNRSDRIWTDTHMGILIAHPDVSQELKWAAEFAGLASLRQEALLQVPWTRVKDTHIDMEGTKWGGKGRGVIPMHGELRDLLARIPRRAATVLTTERGQPWGSGFGASWGKAMIKTGLRSEGINFNDLRGTAATKFYLAGLPIQDIADIMGWKSERVEKLINVYVNRDEIMKARIAKIEQSEAFKRRAGEQS
jgi:hypothetical protein